MQLIGMLDSPYVRRVAVSLTCMGISFEHRAVSVFNDFALFKTLNPVVKAPSLVCDNGDVLMDSSLILEYAESLVPPDRSLLPVDASERQYTFCILGLALAACEKSVQMVYERNLRPPERQHQPWLDRVQGQMLSAFGLLDTALQRRPVEPGAGQAGITSAVVWQFGRSVLPELLKPAEFQELERLSQVSEQLPTFLAFPPDGPGVMPGPP
jgi:glutathione S-transferase